MTKLHGDLIEVNLKLESLDDFVIVGVFSFTVSHKKHVTLLFEHNSNTNCPIIIIFGTVVTESISY